MITILKTGGWRFQLPAASFFWRFSIPAAVLGSTCRAPIAAGAAATNPSELGGRRIQPWPPPFPFLNLSVVLRSTSAAHWVGSWRGCYDQATGRPTWQRAARFHGGSQSPSWWG